MRQILVLLLLLPFTTAVAFRMRNSNSSPSSPAVPKQWEGQYKCQQCPPPSTAGQAVPQTACWNYEIQIYQEAKGLLGHFRIQGNDGVTELRADVSGTKELAEFHYQQALNSGSNPYQPNALLFALERRDDDVLLRFRALKSKIANQSVLICQNTPPAK